MTSASDPLSLLTGAHIEAAFSSLTEFSCQLDNGTGLVIRAIETTKGPTISVVTMAAEDLPRSSDAVCKVDWQWIYGSAIEDIAVSNAVARFRLLPAGPLVISVQVWQGKPFLAFQPFRAT